MKAAQISDYGDPSVIQINEAETPTAGNGQVLVEVHASSINPFDTTIRSGAMKEAVLLEFPATLGGDIAGVITELGKGVSSVSVGDKVYGQANVVAGNSGAFAEYAATSAEQIARAPEGLDYKQIASLPLVGVSALQALTKHIGLKPGQKVFIHGGSGGIGSIAIQIAKHLGAHVATSATEEGVEYVRQLGADEVIDFKVQDFTKVISNYDAVFDTTPGQDFDKSLTVLKPGGVAVSMLVQADENKTKELEVTAITQSTKVNTAALDELCELVEKGIITPTVDRVFSLGEVAEAFKLKENGTVKGKVVIEIR